MTRKRNDFQEELIRDNAFDLPSEEAEPAKFISDELEIDESLLVEAAWDIY